MTLDACTELVRTQDPDRFGAVLVARPQDRPALLTLYALNLEIARAPFQSAEPMLAEMRLQWWIDRLAEMGRGTPPPLHDVLTPLWEAWGAGAGDLAHLAETRRRDCAREPLAGPQAVIDYVQDTAGTLMWLAARRLGAPDTARPVIEAQARGAGLAAWLRALPRLQPLGLGLPQPGDGDVGMLAEYAQQGLAQAAQGHRRVPRTAAAALYPGPRVVPFLDAARRNGMSYLAQASEVTPFQRRASLAGFALTGRWWRHIAARSRA